MKKLFYSCAIMALMASCSSDDEMSTVGEKFTGEVKVTAEAYEFDGNTRTSLTNTGSAIEFAWQNGEAIGVFPIAPTTNNVAKQTITVDGDGLNAEFNGAGWALLKGNTYAAYSPYNENMALKTPYSAIPVTMTGQKQTGNASLKHIGDAYDYMYAKADIPSNGGVVGFSFQHIGAIAMLQLTMPEDASWKSATLTSESSVFISSCTMNVSNGSLANKTTSKSQTLELANVSGKDITLYMAMLPCTTGDLTLTVTSSTSKEYTAKLVSKTLIAGKAYRWEASPKLTKGVPDNVEAVDLGLPSGLKWANMNVGATKPEGKGTYFAWGEVTGCEYINDTDCTPAIMDGNPNSWSAGVNSNYVSGNSKTVYDWSDYKWYNGSTYYKYTTSTKTTLDPEDDAAHVNWGGDWRMPTKAEQDELRNNCTWTWTSDYNGTGVAGRIVTGPNGNSIFLPASGSRNSSSFGGVGAWGLYWSSLLYSGLDDYYACVLYFDDSSVYDSGSGRCCGLSVRAVCR